MTACTVEGVDRIATRTDGAAKRTARGRILTADDGDRKPATSNQLVPAPGRRPETTQWWLCPAPHGLALVPVDPSELNFDKGASCGTGLPLADLAGFRWPARRLGGPLRAPEGASAATGTSSTMAERTGAEQLDPRWTPTHPSTIVDHRKIPANLALPLPHFRTSGESGRQDLKPATARPPEAHERPAPAQIDALLMPWPLSNGWRRGPAEEETTAFAGTSLRVSDGTRTRDRRDHNPELYQLSYRHRAPTG